MGWYESIWVIGFLGEDIRFWITVFVASLLKWLFTPQENQTHRQAIAGVVAGACAAYYGHEKVTEMFASLGPEDKDIVIIGLVLIGEHIVRGVLLYGPKLITKVMETTTKAIDK